MRNIALMVAVAAFPAGVALAQSALADMDADGNGTLSITELQTVYTTLDEAGFTAVDTNADGAVDEAELTAAQTAGTLVAG